MKFTTERRGDTFVVRVPKQLVAENRHQLKQQVVEALAMGVKSVLLDFTGTGYVDSAGLGTLVSLSKAARERAAELRLSNLNDDLRMLFALTKLDELFGIDERPEAADLFPLGGYGPGTRPVVSDVAPPEAGAR